MIEKTDLTRRSFLHAAAALGVCACGLGLAGTAFAEDKKELDGHELNIYCGAGMTDPFTKIADAFQEKTGCTMNVTFANAAQIQTQITTIEEGDFFIAGSVEELEPVADYVHDKLELVKHIPVLVVPKDNPKDIHSLADLEKCDVVLVGDPESTPIGKIAKKVLTKAELWDKLFDAGVIVTTTTAPQISAAIAQGEGDAGIVWKENVKAEGAVITDAPELDKAVKVIPAATLTCCADTEAAEAFLEYLQTDAAWDVWAEFGYEKAEKKPEEKADDTKAEDGKAEGDKPADKPADKAEEKPAK